MPTLKRSIGKWSLVLLIVNSIIGAGIFGLPSKVFALSGTYSLLAFGICAIVVMVFILCFAEISSRFDKTGGPYTYAYNALGKFPGFLTGWLLFLSRVFNYATLINLLVIYLSFFSSSFSQPGTRIVCILTLTISFTIINHIGVKDSTRVNNILTIAKLLPLTAFIVIGLFNIQTGNLAHSQPFQFSSFTTSVLLLVFAFGGFESVLINTGEVLNPRRNLPFALITGFLFITLFYCLIQFVSIGTLPGLASSEKPLAEAAQLFMGNWGGLLIAGGAVISITGTLNAVVLGGSRIPFALSSEGQFPPLFSFIHPQRLTPTWSLVLFIAITTIVSVVWSFFAALTIGSIIRVMVYLMVCISMIRLRLMKPLEKDYFKLRYGYFLAMAGIAFAGWLLFSTRWKDLRDIGIAVFLGIVFYGLYELFKRRE
ncbi:MAG TPA: amino acid permease [Chitinophagaceae bacterium]|nr:amino acid permease [Chitinophagaceae bacterium]